MTKWKLAPAFKWGLSQESDESKDDLVVIPAEMPVDSAPAIALVYRDNEQDDKSAYLIQSAPELLEAARSALSDMERWSRMGAGLEPLQDTPTMAQLRAAIEKAERGLNE